MVLLHDKLFSTSMSIFSQLFRKVTNLVLALYAIYSLCGVIWYFTGSSMPQCIACSRSPHNVLHSPSFLKIVWKCPLKLSRSGASRTAQEKIRVLWCACAEYIIHGGSSKFVGVASVSFRFSFLDLLAPVSSAPKALSVIVMYTMNNHTMRCESVTAVLTKHCI